jgi:putative two-component system response regulator
MEQKQRGYDLGVIDYITKPFEAYVVRRRVQNVVDLYYHRSNLELTAKSQAKRLREQYLKLNDMNEKIVNTLGTIVEFRNMESGLHVLRMKEFTRILIEYMMDNYSEYLLTKDDVDAIVYAAAMHDIGKIHVSDAILLKPGPLTVEEFEAVKVHTTKGADMLRELSTIDDPVYLRYCSEIALSHHERFDGRGYPNGLWGNEIPISAQVVSLVDVYDALVSKRVYKEAYSKEESYNMIMDEQCGVFNPKLLDAFEYCRDKIEEKSDKLV